MEDFPIPVLMADRTIFHVDVNSAFLSWSASYRVNILGEKRLIEKIDGEITRKNKNVMIIM